MRRLASSLFVLVMGVGVTVGCATGTQLGSGGDGAGGSVGTTGGAGATSTGGGGATSTTAGSGGTSETGGGGATGRGGATGGGGTSTTGGGGATGGGGTGGTTIGNGGAGGGVHTCGDLMLAGDEECDGVDFGGKTCESLGFMGGTLKCDPECKLDTSGCTNCGNGVVEPQLGEDCDFDAMGDPLVLTTCAGLGFAGSSANPGCDPTCHYDTTPCLCGNGTVDPGEDCDGADFDGKTCMSFGFAGGMLTCSPECEINAAGCNQCGNGVIDGLEQCDGANLGGKTCQSLGFSGGMLACGPMCQLVTLGCTKCGNNVLEPNEQCDDGNNFSGDGCSSTCQFEIMACDPDGTYAVTMGGPISYTCCSGLVSVNVSSFIFSGDGATIFSSPSNPTPMTGSPTTCPSGSFSNSGTIPGGCSETYSLSGNFISANTWTGLYQLSFTGPDCDCFGGLFGTPCVNQVFSISAQK